MDEDLEQLLANPFAAPVAPKPVPASAAPDARVPDREGRQALDISSFRAPIETVLAPHLAAAKEVEQKVLSPTLPPKLGALLAPYSERYRQNLQELRKAYHSYVETSKDDMLNREAERLKRRYFQEDALPEQIEFIKLKRLYEKIRTFNDFAKGDWLEIQKISDALVVMTDPGGPVSHVVEKTLPPILLLLRRTDTFLDQLKVYLQVEEETNDPVTGSYRVIASYTPEVRFTTAGFFGLEGPLGGAAPKKASEAESTAGLTEESRSPRSLVLDGPASSRSRAAVFRAELLGSRDWNRTPAYSLQLPAAFVEQALENFRSAYQVNIDPKTARAGALSPAAAVVRKGEGEHMLDDYIRLLTEQLDQIAEAIITEDFPGLEKPAVFLYHCGPGVLFAMLISQLRRLGVGEIFYLDPMGNPLQEMPEELIRKTLIEWWNMRFSTLDTEDVDSYLTYSRAIENVKKDYRALYEEGNRLRREEQPGASYVGFERWIRQNRLRVFGARKIEIFRRFLTGTVLHN